jgi:transcriptional regulator
MTVLLIIMLICCADEQIRAANVKNIFEVFLQNTGGILVCVCVVWGGCGFRVRSQTQ